MPDLLRTAKQQAGHAKMPVRAAAFLRIPRVQIAGERPTARSTFNQGLDFIRTLSDIDREFLLEQAALLAAAVCPDLLTRDLSLRPPSGFEPRVFEIMLDHGHQDEAALYLCRMFDEYPTGLTPSVLLSTANETGVALLRRAIALWSNALAENGRAELENGLIQFFQSQWKLLAREEAVAMVHEIVRGVSDAPDHAISFQWNDAVFKSRHPYALFLLFPAVRSLDPDLAKSLAATYPELASAVLKYPNGMEQIGAESGIATRQTRRREEELCDRFLRIEITAQCSKPRNSNTGRTVMRRIQTWLRRKSGPLRHVFAE